jgi:chromate transporter
MSALAAAPALPAAAPPARPTLGEATRLWFRIGCLSFGGPAGQIALMHRLLVEQRRWIDETRFLHALNYCMLLPGPEAQQLATYIGWLLHRTLGGLIAGLLFILPGALLMLALSLAYAQHAGLPLVAAAFVGVKAAVLVIVLEALLRIGRRALRAWPMYVIAALAFLAIFAYGVPFPWIVLSAALAGLLGGLLRPALFSLARGGAIAAGPPSVVDAMAAAGELGHTRPSPRRALVLLLVFALLWGGAILLLCRVFGPAHVLTQEGLYFSRLAVVTFGGAYAVLADMAQQAVETYGWLDHATMLDGLGLAETTPGPLILVTQFVGFLAAWNQPGALAPATAGTLGALVTTWVTFVPCFLWILLGAPWIEQLRGNRHLTAALSGITAAVVGVVLNLTLWFALQVTFAEVGSLRFAGMRLPLPAPASLDWTSLAITLGAGVLLLRLHLGVVPVLGAAAAAGLLLALA